MKKLFALFMLVAALSIGSTNYVQASDLGFDVDVGYTITQWTPAADMQHFYMDDVIPLTKIEPMANVQTTCEFYYALQLRHRAQPYKFWEGGSTKASLCKSVCDNYSPVLLPFPSFGRDIRRLLCEAKG